MGLGPGDIHYTYQSPHKDRRTTVRERENKRERAQKREGERSREEIRVIQGSVCDWPHSAGGAFSPLHGSL